MVGCGGGPHPDSSALVWFCSPSLLGHVPEEGVTTPVTTLLRSGIRYDRADHTGSS